VKKELPKLMVLLLLIALVMAAGGNGGAGAQTRGPHIQLLVDGVTVYDSGGAATPEPTREPTVAPTAATEPTPTAAPGHDTSLWHEPALGHHHGPPHADASPPIVHWLETHPWGASFLAIGGFEPTSAAENGWPYPGKHAGFKRIVENNIYDPNVKDGNVPLPGELCIDSIFLVVHDLGTAHEFRTPDSIHSLAIVAAVDDDCNPATPLPDDSIIAIATHGFYGERHAAYKEVLCDPNLPPVYPDGQSLSQPPYVTVNTSTREWVYWNTNTNALMQQFFEPDVNTAFQVAWAARVWETPALNDCGNPAADVAFCPADGSCGANGTRFQIFTVEIPVTGPREGFVDRYGAPAPACSAIGPGCFPYYVGAGVPVGTAVVRRTPHVGNPNDAPFLDYATNAALVMPGHEFDDGAPLEMPTHP
jgi:hypothetical protein